MTQTNAKDSDTRCIYATEGLIDVLLRFAADAEPSKATVTLGTTRGSALDAPAPVPDDVPVFTHFYLPEAAESTRAVFGVDLSVPLGQTHGRFVSHPRSERAPTLTDDFHEVIFVAVPPWDRDSVRAYERRGRRIPLELVDTTLPAADAPGFEAPVEGPT